MVLIGLGDSVVANALLAKSKAENSGWMAITTGWGLAVLFGVLCSLAVGGVAHLNPAITLALAIASGDFSNVVPFIAAQMAGGFCGAVLVWLAFLSHWGPTADTGLKLAVFCTGPAIRHLSRNALTEVIATMFLVIAGFAIGSKGVAANGLPAGFGPYLWGMLVWCLGLALGGPTGYALNPARDLAPRFAHQVLPIEGKGDSDWGYAAIPVVAPLVGGAVGALVCKATGII
jgi:glycerol uptake facilitator protein